MKYKYRLLTQSQLGQLFGASSHEIGKWLVSCGLRNEKTKKPTAEAHQDGFCDVAPSGQGQYCYAWVAEKTVPRLVGAGHTPLSVLPEELVEPVALNGPFRLSIACPSEVLNADGTLAVRAAGRRNAELVMKLLTLADRNGIINRFAGGYQSTKNGTA